MKTDKNITLVAVTWNHEDTFPINETPLYPSFKKHNPDSKFAHIHFNRNHYTELEREFDKRFSGEYPFFLYKVQLLGDKIKKLDTDYIIVADATDVVCQKSVKFLPEVYDLDNFIVTCQEKNTWPTAAHKAQWPDYTDYSEAENFNQTYLNSGMVLARKEKYVEMLDSMIKNVLVTDCKFFANCQGVYTYYYNKKIEPQIRLDYNSIMTLNTFKRTTEDCYLENNQIVIKQTGVRPCFIHDNGWNHGSPRYITAFDLKTINS